MALILSGAVQVVKSPGLFIFTETTGDYDVSLNPGGYGAPNPEIADCTEATLTVYLPDETTKFPGDSFVVFSSASTEPFYPLFPNVDSIGYSITGEMLGYGANSVPEDGVYRFVYDMVIDDETVYSYDQYVLFDAGVRCCLAKLFSKGVSTGCGCGKNMTSYEKGMLMLNGAEMAMDCNNPEVAAKAIVKAIEVCGGCSGC